MGLVTYYQSTASIPSMHICNGDYYINLSFENSHSESITNQNWSRQGSWKKKLSTSELSMVDKEAPVSMTFNFSLTRVYRFPSKLSSSRSISASLILLTPRNTIYPEKSLITNLSGLYDRYFSFWDLLLGEHWH